MNCILSSFPNTNQGTSFLHSVTTNSNKMATGAARLRKNRDDNIVIEALKQHVSLVLQAAAFLRTHHDAHQRVRDVLISNEQLTKCDSFLALRVGRANLADISITHKQSDDSCEPTQFQFAPASAYLMTEISLSIACSTQLCAAFARASVFEPATGLPYSSPCLTLALAAFTSKC